MFHSAGCGGLLVCYTMQGYNYLLSRAWKHFTSIEVLQCALTNVNGHYIHFPNGWMEAQRARPDQGAVMRSMRFLLVVLWSNHETTSLPWQAPRWLAQYTLIWQNPSSPRLKHQSSGDHSFSLYMCCGPPWWWTFLTSVAQCSVGTLPQGHSSSAVLVSSLAFISPPAFVGALWTQIFTSCPFVPDMYYLPYPVEYMAWGRGGLAWAWAQLGYPESVQEGRDLGASPALSSPHFWQFSHRLLISSGELRLCLNAVLLVLFLMSLELTTVEPFLKIALFLRVCWSSGT